MTRTIRSITTKVGAKAAIATSTVLYSAFGNRSNDEELRPLLEPSAAPSSTRSNTDDFMSCDIDPETWELEAAALRPDQIRLWREECEARDKEMASLHQLHTFGKYAQRTRTNKHGITRDNPDHHIVRVQPPVQNVVNSEKASMHNAASPYNASSPAKATWEQEAGIIRTSPPTVYEYSASVYSRPTRTIKSGASPTKGDDANSPTRASKAASQHQTGIENTPTLPVESAEHNSKRASYSSAGKSSSSSLKQRGALRHRANPLFARPVADDFERNKIIGKEHGS